MKVIRIALTLGLFTAVLAADENVEYEYEDSEAPVAPVAPVQRGRPSVLASRQAKPSPLTISNSKINRLPAAAGKSAAKSTTASPPPPQEAREEVENEEVAEEQQAGEEASTEPAKKTIKPVVRPFRSNDDLLAALKRRRQQVQHSGAVVDRTSGTTSTSAPSSQHKKSSSSYGASGRRGRVGNAKPTPAPVAEVSAETESTKKAQPRKYNSRNSGRSSAPAVVEEEKPAEEQPKPKFGRGSRRPTS